MIAVDTNVLVYAHREELPLHADALTALTRLAEGDEPWGIPVFCALEFLRVVTHRKLFDPPTTPQEATTFVDVLLTSPTGRLLLPNHRFWRGAATLVVDEDVSGNAIYDAGIAACCVTTGARTILSEDRDFDRHRGIDRLGVAEYLELCGL